MRYIIGAITAFYVQLRLKSNICDPVLPDLQLKTIHKLAEAQSNKDISFWTSVGLQMQRNPHRCKDIWERRTDTSKGRYTEEEDALIRQRIGEQNSTGPGFWAKLGRELDRPARTVRAHWLEMSAVKDKNSILWTEEMVRRGLPHCLLS